LTTTTGVKIFYSRKNRDHSHFGQKLAAKKRLAPPAGQRFRICNLEIPSEVEQYWLDSSWSKELRYDSDSTVFYGYVTGVANEVCETEWEEEEKLEDELLAIGLSAEDLGSANMGRYGKDDRLVCIDFGRISTPTRR